MNVPDKQGTVRALTIANSTPVILQAPARIVKPKAIGERPRQTISIALDPSIVSTRIHRPLHTCIT
jgi:hypothetical protein